MNEQIEAAIKVLKEGGVILYPTDTIWGLGCDATNPQAVEKIYKIKNRAESKSLIVLAADADMICRYVKEIPEMAITLLEINDKPMTIIYPGAMGLANNAVAEDGSIGIRVPEHQFCKALLKKFRKPIISTSANISGEPTPLGFQNISQSVKNQVDYIVNQEIGIIEDMKPSTIIRFTDNYNFEIVRE